MPLRKWLELSRPHEPTLLQGDVAYLSRRVEGRFDEGLFSGRLTLQVEVIGDGPARVAVIDDDAAIGAVALDGKATALVKDRSGNKRMFRLYDVAPGRHTIELSFHVGSQTRRFNSRLKFRLPDGGATSFAIRVGERFIEPSLKFGVISASRDDGGGTLVEGHVGGFLDLAWKSRPSTETGPTVDAKLRANQSTVLSISEALVTGTSVVDLDVLDGETDRIMLTLPDELEVLRVEGDEVLQWQTSPGALAVLLRHLIDDRTTLTITFQSPVTSDGDGVQRLSLAIPSPNAPLSGVVGVRGPTGLSVKPVSVERAEELGPRELPEALTSMAATPVLFGFRYEQLSHEQTPEVIIEVKRQEELELTSTLIDELQASTVILEDGRELTKMKLRIRNNARQYLGLRLPNDAVLTHSLIDGRQIRPAVSDVGLMFPLRRSERVGAKRTHIVRPGETLSDVANLYYSDPSAWTRIFQVNRDKIGAGHELERGDELRIPQQDHAQESSFIVEVAYERGAGDLGHAGRRALTLPVPDVDTVRAVWHVYVPRSHRALSWSGNLTQVSRVAYDPFRRLKFFLQEALSVKEAFAGDKYKNILSTRRKLYREESTARADSDVVLTSFPLVGERYRFRRLLLGREQPSLSVAYARTSYVDAARWGALIAAFALLLWALLGVRRVARWSVAAVGVAGLLVVAHHVRGVNQRIVWAADLALLVAIIKTQWPALKTWSKALLRRPWTLIESLSAKRWLTLAASCWLIGVMLDYPMLLSLAALAGLAAGWWLSTRPRAVAAAAAMALLFGLAPDARAEQTADQLYDNILNSKAQSELKRPKPPSVEGQVTLPLADVEAAARRIVAAPRDRSVTMGAASYRGNVVDGVLELTAELNVVLRGHGLKQVPLVGTDVVLLSASVDGADVAMTKRPGYHVWLTRREGAVKIRLSLLAAARGPRGSIEYSFRSVRATTATIALDTTTDNLEPRFDGAIRSQVSKIAGGTRVRATVGPTTRIRMVGFRDLLADSQDEASERKTRMYVETASLLSVDKAAAELFTALRYTILYAPAKRFDIAIPAGFEVVSADGEGAFRWNVEGGMLRGETALPIRGKYEVSLRLRRQLRADEDWKLDVPQCTDVERQHGWLGIEVPGKLQLEQVTEHNFIGIDVRQLPNEVLDAAVSPILSAYRYHKDAPSLAVEVSQLPESELRSDAIDKVEAVSVLSTEGKLLSQLSITMRNSVRQSLALGLPEDTVVRSTLLDGQPVKPSRRDDGKLLLPLKRSAALEAFTLTLVVESTVGGLGLFGKKTLIVPQLELPVASLKWQLHLPATNDYGDMQTGVGEQALWGTASWHKPPHLGGAVRWDHAATPDETSAVSGTMPVRFEIPTGGVALEHQRYWVGADEPVIVALPYVRSWVLLPLQMLLVLLMVLIGCGLRFNRPTTWAAVLASLAALWALDAAVVGAVALALGVTVRRATNARYDRVPRLLRVYVKRMPSRFRIWRKQITWTRRQWAYRSVLLLAFGVVTIMLTSRALSLLEAIAVRM